MSSAARRSPNAPGGFGLKLREQFSGPLGEGVAILAVSGALLWLVWVYGNGLRDPRFFDGWLLATGMSLQIYFHLRIKTSSFAPKAAKRWRHIHVYLGYVMLALFISHSDFGFPDTGFEWALWTGFVLITLSGIFGTYLSWSVRAKRKVDERISYDRIPARRAEIAREIHAVVSAPSRPPAALALPSPPYDDWITDLYTGQLQSFFRGQQNFGAHLIGSQRPVARLIEEIENLERYVDQKGQDKLLSVKALVLEKDKLDFARVYLGLTKAWLFVHVPVTYGFFLLIVLHVLVVYAYSSGVW